MIRRIAWTVHARVSSAIEIGDLIQTGMVALIEAAQGFEDRGLPFAPYAATRIRGAMIDALRRQARLTRSATRHRHRIDAVRRSLEQKLWRRATDQEMAEELGLKLPDYLMLVQASVPAQFTPLDEAYSDSDMAFADGGEGADCRIERAQMQAELARCISNLPEREALVLQLYFVEGLNLDEIAAILSLGAPRICQIKKAAIGRLRGMMADADAP